MDQPAGTPFSLSWKFRAFIKRKGWKQMSALDDRQKSRIEATLRLRHGILREEIRAGLLASDEQHHRDIAGMVGDVGDESVANLLTEVNLKGVDRDARELGEVEAALERLARGALGVCADCGGGIGYARLEAQPAATRCIACQRRHDSAYAHDSAPTL